MTIAGNLGTCCAALSASARTPHRGHAKTVGSVLIDPREAGRALNGSCPDRRIPGKPLSVGFRRKLSETQ